MGFLVFMVVTFLQFTRLLMFCLKRFTSKDVPVDYSTSYGAVRRPPCVISRKRLSADSNTKLRILSDTFLSTFLMIVGVSTAVLEEPSFWQTLSLGPPSGTASCLIYLLFSVSSRLLPVSGKCFFLCRNLHLCQPRLNCDSDVDAHDECIH